MDRFKRTRNRGQMLQARDYATDPNNPDNPTSPVKSLPMIPRVNINNPNKPVVIQRNNFALNSVNQGLNQ